jgi:PAS domain S-box-containing protein
MATILIVDDQPVNLKILVEFLRKKEHRLLVAESGERAIELAKVQQPDIILMDIMMPGMDGFEVCRRLKDDALLADIPIIFVTALGDVEDKTKAFNAGCVDFITKPFHKQEVLLRINNHLTIRQQQQQIEQEKEMLAVTLRSIGDAVIATDIEGRVTLVNKVTEQLTGWSREEAIGQPLTRVFHIINEQSREVCENPVEKVLETGHIIGLANHTALIAKDGTERSIADSAAPIHDRKSNIIGVVLVFRDVTVENRLAGELAKTKKLESIGVLAGGIAHDFNNILTGITGSFGLAKLQLASDHPAFELMEAGEKAAMRGARLTKQLLTFAKGGAPIKECSSVYDVIKESCDFSLVGSSVACRVDRDGNLWNAEIDKGQISQVVQNLILNGSQAMPEGGTIEVLCDNYSHIPEKTGDLPLAVGEYIRIAVTDYGIGIPAAVVPKIFDPYFSTKQKGSGLGLAVCHSIVKKHDGHIHCVSESGHGTTFSVYLPASSKTAQKQTAVSELELGEGKILIMDDEPFVRDIASRMLSLLGFEVAVASDGEEAVQMYQQALQTPAESYAAVIMDLTIPGGMGGKEAAEEILRIDDSAVLLVSSGYSNDPVMAEFKKYGFCGAVAKPFDMKELSGIMASVL